jgi:hypothetical protein
VFDTRIQIVLVPGTTSFRVTGGVSAGFIMTAANVGRSHACGALHGCVRNLESVDGRIYKFQRRRVYCTKYHKSTFMIHINT